MVFVAIAVGVVLAIALLGPVALYLLANRKSK